MHPSDEFSFDICSTDKLDSTYLLLPMPIIFRNRVVQLRQGRGCIGGLQHGASSKVVRREHGIGSIRAIVLSMTFHTVSPPVCNTIKVASPTGQMLGRTRIVRGHRIMSCAAHHLQDTFLRRGKLGYVMLGMGPPDVLLH